MIFKSRYNDRKFFNNNNRDFYDAGYADALKKEEIVVKMDECVEEQNDSWFKPALVTLTLALAISLAMFIFGDEELGTSLLWMFSIFMFLVLFFKNQITRSVS